jgi:hypothetical protein
LIGDVAALLANLSAAEAKKLAEHDIKHAPTIGAMYEGLTRDILARAVPQGVGLRVVDGFVTDGAGGRSGQIDGMLVRGDGVAVPYTSQFEWHVKDVLAVFEVKKTLTAAAIADAYDQMTGVMACFNAWYRATDFNLDAWEPAFRTYAEITGQVAPPPDEWDAMDRNLANILYTLRAEQFAPLRIILGYGGYKTESGLRGAYLDYLETKQRVGGYAPLDFPNLIVGEGASLIKLCGFPYWAARTAKGDWPLVASSRLNAQQLLLELIWTKISLDHDVAELFGEDLDVEVMPVLVRGQVIKDPEGTDQWGWAFLATDPGKPALDKLPLSEGWAPAEIDAFTFDLLIECSLAGLDFDDPETQAEIASAGLTEEAVVAALVETRLVAMNGRRLEIIAKALVLRAHGDRYFAAENNTGRFDRWLKKLAQA